VGVGEGCYPASLESKLARIHFVAPLRALTVDARNSPATHASWTARLTLGYTILFDGGKSATCIGVITAIRAAINATPSQPRSAGGLARTISASGSRAASSSASAIISRAYAARWWRRWRRRAQRRIALIAAVIAAGCPALGLFGTTWISGTPSRIILVAAVRAANISTLRGCRSASTCAAEGRSRRAAM
jgi:hypothetical protein